MHDDTTTSAPPSTPPSSPSTSSAVASPARTSVSPGAGSASTGSEAGSSTTSWRSFATFDPASSCWRMSQRSLLGDSEAFSSSWPRAGMTRSGTAYQLPPSAPLTRGIASGLLPTPAATEAGSNQNGSNSDRPSAGTPTLYTLARQGRLPTPTSRLGDPKRGMPATARWASGRRNLDDAMMLPTPTANRSTWHNSHGKEVPTLHAEAGALPTPHARDWKGDGKDCLPSALDVGGSLHPRFVEWMMGFPPGWTDLDDDDR